MGVQGSLAWAPSSDFILGEGSEKAKGKFVFIWPLGGTEKRILSEYDTYGLEMRPVLDPEGSKVAYTSFAENGIVIINLSTLEKGVIDGENPAWANDPNKLYFVKYGDVLAYYNLVDEKVVELYDFSPDRKIIDVEFSPDGNTLLLLVLSEHASDPGTKLIKFSIENLTEENVDIDRISKLVGWTPDSQWLIYSESTDRKDIFAINVQKTCTSSQLALKQLHTDYISSIAWSPNQDQIAISGEFGSQAGIFIVQDEALKGWPNLEMCSPLD
jgi:WD40 repeat protein